MKNPLENITNIRELTGKAKSNKEKSQTELREALNKRFLGMKSTIQQATEEYKTALRDGSFEDTEGEEENAGEKRKEALQDKINALFDRAEQMKAKLNSKEKLPNFTETISATYTRPDKKIENIEFSFEEKFEENIEVYKETKLDLPPDFKDSIREIWERNSDDIQKAIEENGFDEMLFVPNNTSLVELNTKMTDGYNETYQYEDFKSSGSFAGAKSQNVDKVRIVLVHKVQNLKDDPELAKTLNIKGKDAIKSEILTLEDYLVFQRKYFKETGEHLDKYGWTWLATKFITKSDTRLVNARWHPDDGQVLVYADDLDCQNEDLGARPSCSFF